MSDPTSIVQSIYACFGRGDIPGLLSRLAPDVRWHFIGDRAAAYTGTAVGHAQVAEWFGAVGAADEVLAFEPRRFLAGADHVTVQGWERCVARGTGKTFETEWVHVWRVQGGLVSAFTGIFDTEAAARARAKARCGRYARPHDRTRPAPPQRRRAGPPGAGAGRAV